MQQNKGVKQEGESKGMVGPQPRGQGRKVQTQLSVDSESPSRHERRGPGVVFRKKSEGDPQNESVTKGWGKLRI